MTSEYIASKLALLPQFEVCSVDRELVKYFRGIVLLGRFSSPVPAKHHAAHFHLPDLRGISGTLLAVPEGDQVRLLHDCQGVELTDEELLGSTFAYCGRLYTHLLTLVLDPAIIWVEERVPPEPMLAAPFVDEDGKTHYIPTRNVDPKVLQGRSDIVEVDWSHRHCSFCSGRTESGELGYVGIDDKGRRDWVCTWCYTHAVADHDPRPLLIHKTDRQ